MIVSQVIVNTQQVSDDCQSNRQLIWGPSRYIGENQFTGYKLLSVDLVTGECLLKSPRMRTPRHHHQYEVFLYTVPPGKRRCSCPGFAGWDYCKHSGVNGIAWCLAWAQADGKESVTATRAGLSLSGHYNLPTVPVEVRGCGPTVGTRHDGELEAEHRWLFEEWEEA